MAFTDNEKWQAVLECDETFDGQFYYGVKTTGVFCRPSCKSKTPLRKNVEFFDTIESAFAFGLRPCKRCRPDRLSYHPKSELIEQAKNIYDTYFDDGVKLSLGIKQLNISQNHLIRIFHQQLNLTPGQYLQKLRIEKALELLANPDSKILNIAFICGFGSLSNFNVCFKKKVGLTPTEYRKQKIVPTGYSSLW
ncbi:MAG TPA: AraC family transcriptional regulator [Firmicutes bacterium]|nr:AraC family transcriptional regulator [Bacillota bacterium]